MLQDPQDLYDPNGTTDTEVKPPKVKGGSSTTAVDDYMKMRGTSGQTMSRAGSTFKVDGVDKSDQQKFFGDTGIADPALTGQDIALEAGNRQSFGNKLARRAANLVPNMAAGIVDMVGNVGSLLTEWGDERDYHNALNDLADSIKDPAGKLYHRSNDTWAIGDPTWWIDHIGGFAELAGTFAIGGAGISKVLGGVAKLATGAADLAETSKLVQAGTQLANSSLMSYIMGAQGGAHVYKEVYDTQLTKAIADGLDPDAAKERATHIAAQSAASTAQLTTMLTVGMNVGMFAPYFKSQGRVVEDIIGKNIGSMQRAGVEDIAGGIRGMSAADYADKLYHNSSILSKLGEMGKIGTEMTMIKFAEATGADMGNKGETKGFIQQLGELSHLTDRVGNSEGLLSFVMGAAMGGLQHFLTHNVIPSRSIERFAPDGTPLQSFNKTGEPMVDDAGKPVIQKTWVTPRTYERDFTKRRFDNIKDSVARDFDNFDEAQNDMLTAVKAGKPLEADIARDKLFDTGRMYAIKAGLTEPWKKTFDKIAEMTPEQAVDAGYATDVNDSSYKDKAEKAKTDMDHFTKVYEGLKQKYGGSESVEPLIDMALARHVDIYSMGERIKEYRTDLEKREAEEKELTQLTDPQGYNDMLANYLRQHSSATEVERQLVEDHAALMNGDTATVNRILKKYRAIGYGDGDLKEPIADLDRKMRAKQEEVNARVKNAENAILSIPEYTKWLEAHPEGKFDEFLQEVNKSNNLSLENRARRAELASVESIHEIAKNNLSDMVSDKSVKKFSRKVNEWMNSMREEADKAEEARTTKLAEMVKDKSALDRLEKIQLNRIAEDYRTQRDNTYKTIAENNKKIADLKDALDKQSRWDPVKTVGIRKQLKALQEHNKTLDAHAKKLDSLFNEYYVDTTGSEDPIEAEDVTGEDGGKTTESSNEFPTTTTTNDTGNGIAIIGEPEVITQPLELSLSTEPVVTQTTLFNDPVSVYAEMYKGLDRGIKGRLTRLVNDALDGRIHAMSYDYLDNFVKNGKLTQEKAAQLIQAADEYVRELQRIKAEEEVEQFEETHNPEPQPQGPKDQVSVNGIEPPLTPVINTDPLTEIVPENSGYTAGYKIVEAAETGATLTQGYEEGTRKDKKGKTIFFKVTKPDALNKELNEDVLLPNSLKPGHPIRFEVDMDYNGPKIISESLTWDNDGQVETGTEKGIDYLDDNGKVKSSGTLNVPIKVMDAQTGKYLFHVRKMDWLLDKFPGSENLRNIAEEVTVMTDEGPIRVDNIQPQIDKLKALRERIVEKWNVEGKHVEATLGEKGTGRLILNYQTTKGTGTSMKSEIVKELAYNKSNPDKSMLPDKTLQIVITDDGGILTSARNYEFTGELGFDSKQLIKGGVGAMVKSANGKYMYAPLIGMKLVEPGKPSPALNSVARAIELYLLNDGTRPSIGAEIDNLQSSTGFNVGTTQGLEGLINQYYTYSQFFMDAALSPNNASVLKGQNVPDWAEAPGEFIKSEQFFFSIDTKGDGVLDKTKQIKAGFSMRGDGVQYANLENGSLSPAFIELLSQGLSTRSKAVVYTNAELGLKGINSDSKFVDATYNPVKGKWNHEPYDNYNEYVKSFSKTPVYGRNQLSDGSYVYTANPHLPMNIDRIITETQVIAEPNKSAEKVETDLPDSSFTFDDLFNASLVPVPAKLVKEMGTGSEKSKELTLDTLEKMYNFTPEGQRNGKTVREVFEQLQTRGHTYLSDGFNPFSRCL